MAKRPAKVSPTAIILVLNNGLLRDSIKVALADIPDLEVVGEAEDTEEARSLIEATDAQILLIGTTLARSLMVSAAVDRNKTRIVLIVPADIATMRVAELFMLGPQAIVPNNIKVATLVQVLQLVNQGMVVLPPCTVGSGNESWRVLSNRLPSDVRLAPREKEMLQLLAQGFSEKEVTRMLGIGPRTVQTYLGRIRGKLGATNRVHAVALGVTLQLVSAHREEGRAN